MSSLTIYGKRPAAVSALNLSLQEDGRCNAAKMPEESSENAPPPGG